MFVNALVGVELVELIHLSVYGGPTATFASGYIFQWNARFEDVPYDTAVAGIGGILMLRCNPLRVGSFGLGVVAGGGIILYSAKFPPGGDWYNLFWKIGLTATVTLTDRMALYVGVRAMHVSHGQGSDSTTRRTNGTGSRSAEMGDALVEERRPARTTSIPKIPSTIRPTPPRGGCLPDSLAFSGERPP